MWCVALHPVGQGVQHTHTHTQKHNSHDSVGYTSNCVIETEGGLCQHTNRKRCPTVQGYEHTVCSFSQKITFQFPTFQYFHTNHTISRCTVQVSGEREQLSLGSILLAFLSFFVRNTISSAHNTEAPPRHF